MPDQQVSGRVVEVDDASALLSPLQPRDRRSPHAQREQQRRSWSSISKMRQDPQVVVVVARSGVEGEDEEWKVRACFAMGGVSSAHPLALPPPPPPRVAVRAVIRSYRRRDAGNPTFPTALDGSQTRRCYFTNGQHVNNKMIRPEG